MSDETFKRLADLLHAQGIERDRSYRLAAQVGDTPVMDGRTLVVKDRGVEVLRVLLPEGMFQ